MRHETSPAKTDALDRLSSGIAALTSSDAWSQYLATQAKFHNYSFRNSLLIALQRPDATQIAGFRKWLEMGRHVRKGEKGIYILAPMVCADKDEAGEKTGTSTIKGFRMVAVFDVAQTDGEDLPEICSTLIGKDPTDAYGRLECVASDLGFTVSLVDECLGKPGANGVTFFGRDAITGVGRMIQIKATNEPAQRVKTLAHELGHAILHDPETTPSSSRELKELKELEAESVAFVVCEALGIDSSVYSFGYVVTWAGADKAAELIAASGTRIQKAAHQILDALVREPVAIAA